jgi:hypothetical protein
VLKKRERKRRRERRERREEKEERKKRRERYIDITATVHKYQHILHYGRKFSNFKKNPINQFTNSTLNRLYQLIIRFDYIS